MAKSARSLAPMRPARPLWLLAASLFCLVLSCGDWTRGINKTVKAAPPGVPDVVIRDFHTDFLALNVRRWQLKAGLAELYQKENRFFLTNIHLENFNDSGIVVSQVRADFGTIFNDTKNITLSNAVTLASSNGTTCTGNLFYWNNASEQFTSPGHVTVVNAKGDRISGVGFVADRRLDTYTFYNAEGEVQDSKGKF